MGSKQLITFWTRAEVVKHPGSDVIQPITATLLQNQHKVTSQTTEQTALTLNELDYNPNYSMLIKTKKALAFEYPVTILHHKSGKQNPLNRRNTGERVHYFKPKRQAALARCF